eukprot:2731432-Rhodomonas_salina.1
MVAPRAGRDPPPARVDEQVDAALVVDISLAPRLVAERGDHDGALRAEDVVGAEHLALLGLLHRIVLERLERLVRPRKVAVQRPAGRAVVVLLEQRVLREDLGRHARVILGRVLRQLLEALRPLLEEHAVRHGVAQRVLKAADEHGPAARVARLEEERRKERVLLLVRVARTQDVAQLLEVRERIEHVSLDVNQLDGHALCVVVELGLAVVEDDLGTSHRELLDGQLQALHGPGRVQGLRKAQTDPLHVMVVVVVVLVQPGQLLKPVELQLLLPHRECPVALREGHCRGRQWAGLRHQTRRIERECGRDRNIARDGDRGDWYPCRETGRDRHGVPMRRQPHRRGRPAPHHHGRGRHAAAISSGTARRVQLTSGSGSARRVQCTSGSAGRVHCSCVIGRIWSG